MTAGAAFFQKQAMSKLNFLLCRLLELWNASEEVRIGELGRHVLRDLVEIFIRPAVARHPGMRQIALWVAKPCDEPIRVDLAADFRQLWAYIAAAQLCLTRTGDRKCGALRSEHL